MNNNFDLNRFNSFLDKATQSISCDSECQKRQVEQQLKDNYLKAQANLTLAEPEFQNAKKNYYTYVSGENGYNEMMEEEIKHTADLIVEKFKEIYQSEIANIQSQLKTYNSLLTNFKNVDDLRIKYKRENKILYKQFKENTHDILTNERKSYYEEQQINSLNGYYYYILLVIYIIVFLFLIFFTLTTNYQNTLKSKIFLIVIFLVLPFFSTFFLGKAIYVLYWLFGLLPKNVYK